MARGTSKKARGRAIARGNGGFERLPAGDLPRRGPTPKQMPMPGRGPAANSSITASPHKAGRQIGGGRGRGKGGAKAGISGAAIPGLGAQLTRRVQSGAITREQAERTAKQRQTLKKAFGDDWRTKVFGAVGAVRSARVGAAKHPDSARFAALNKALAAKRKQALERARAKNSSDEE